MEKSLLNLVAICGFSLLTMSAYADQSSKGTDMAGMKMDSVPTRPAKATALSDGEVKAVDKENKSITLKHGRIKSATVEMGAMTMPFAVKDKVLLSNVKVGDKVKFTVENIESVPTVTTLSVQK